MGGKLAAINVQAPDGMGCDAASVQASLSGISKVYDLKGSMRNRFQANQNATLLDENLVLRAARHSGQRGALLCNSISFF